MDSPTNRCVLLVHSCPIWCGRKAAELRRAGYDVRECRDPAALAAVVEMWRPAVVVLDVTPPGTERLELCRGLKARWRDEVMVLLSLDLGTSAGGWAAEAQADGLVVDEVCPDSLLLTVAALVRLQNAAAAARAIAATEQKSRDQANFMAAAAHDLRQPVQAVRLLLTVLNERLHDHRNRDVLARALDGLDSLEKLLRALMDLSALEDGRVAPRLELVDLGELVRRVASTHAPEAAAKQLRLKVRAQPMLALTDPVLAERIVRNLLTNAIRYTRYGGVLIACRRSAEAASIEVWDTGIGIPPEQLSSVFDDFRQISGERGQGLGIGLAVVAKTARLLGHEIKASSRLGRGSVFRLRIPFVELPTAQLRQATQPAA